MLTLRQLQRTAALIFPGEVIKNGEADVRTPFPPALAITRETKEKRYQTVGTRAHHAVLFFFASCLVLGWMRF